MWNWLELASDLVYVLVLLVLQFWFLFAAFGLVREPSHSSQLLALGVACATAGRYEINKHKAKR